MSPHRSLSRPYRLSAEVGHAGVACPIRKGLGLHDARRDPYMRSARSSNIDALSIEYLFSEHDHRGMPEVVPSVTEIFYMPKVRTHHIPSICRPVSCAESERAMPLLRS
jgi:hypothetical protein